MDKEDDKKWEILHSEYLIRRPWLTARRDCVRLPDGVVNDEYYVLEYPDWVNVIAITTEGKFLMERQYRHGLQWTGYEICAGVCEKGEQPLESAKRELYEETGYAGGTWTDFMTLSANTSTMNNLCHCFLAEGVEQVSGQHCFLLHVTLDAVGIVYISQGKDAFGVNARQRRTYGRGTRREQQFVVRFGIGLSGRTNGYFLLLHVDGRYFRTRTYIDVETFSE